MTRDRLIRSVYAVLLLSAIIVPWAGSPLVAGITEPCLAIKIPLTDRIKSSQSVVYGRVVAQRAVWDDARRSIYTINTVVVNDVWKATASIDDTIVVLTEGGDMGTMGRTVLGTLKLDVGDEGYLLLEKSRTADVTFTNAGVRQFFRPYAESQAFLIIHNSGEVFDCWGTTTLAPTSFEERYLNVLGHTMYSARGRSTAQPDRTLTLQEGELSFSPRRVIGGMGEAITITGAGFGAQRGSNYVTFTADGTNYHSSSYAASFVYRSWSDTAIVVEVPPSYSGKIHVVIGSAAIVSKDTLRVTSNLAARSLSPLTFTNLINTNGKGGYTWSLDKALYDIPEARECVESVMRQFRCKTGMMFDLSATPATTGYALNDGINAIVFDAPGYELGAGAVAYCDWIWYSCIVGTETFYYVRDTDCRLSRKFNWYYGNGKNPQFGMAKLRYVLYHEIGHAHQFGHVNEWGESMHPVVQALPAEEWLERDTITESEKRAGTFMTQQGRSFAFRGCGIQPLLPPANDDCNSDPTSDIHDGADRTLLDLAAHPNPTSGVLTIQSTSVRSHDVRIELFDMLGSRVLQEVLPAGSERVSISVTSLAAGTYVLMSVEGADVGMIGLITVGQ